MGKHADDFVWVLRLTQEPGIDEDALATCHKGIDARLLHQIDVYRCLVDARDSENRARINAHQVFDFGIADERQVILALRRRRLGRGEEKACRDPCADRFQQHWLTHTTSHGLSFDPGISLIAKYGEFEARAST